MPRIISCKKEIGSDTSGTPSKNKIKEKISPQSDSITISVDLKPKMSIGFNMFHKPFDEFHLAFSNPSDKDSTIVKKLANENIYRIMIYNAYIITDGKSKLTKSYFLAGKDNSKLEFRFNEGYVTLKNKEDNIAINDLFNDCLYYCIAGFEKGHHLF